MDFTMYSVVEHPDMDTIRATSTNFTVEIDLKSIVPPKAVLDKSIINHGTISL